MAKSHKKILQDIEESLDMIAPSDVDRLELLSKLCTWAAIKRAEADKSKICNYEVFSNFFDTWFVDAGVDLLSGKLMQKHRGRWGFVNHGALKSVAHSAGMDRHFIDDHLAQWTMEQEPKILVSFPDYDGGSHIRQIADCAEYKGFSVDEVEQFLKDWMAGVWRRVQDQNKQNRFLLFRGPQGVGKDWLIRLLCEPWDFYFTNFTMQSQERDVFDQVSSSIIVNFSEFDQTEKMNVAFLKDMVTKYKATFRRSHARDAESRQFHCSFIGTTNQQYIMRDETGNRRFVILDIQKMDWEKMRSVNYTQAWAEARHLCESGYKISTKTAAKMDDFMDRETPENDLEDNVIELWNEAVGPILRNKQTDRLRYVDVKEVFKNIKSDLSIHSMRKIQGIIRRNNGQFKSDGARYYRLCVTNLLVPCGPKVPEKRKTDLPNYAKGLGN